METKLYEPAIATSRLFVGILCIAMVVIMLLSRIEDFNMALVFMLPLTVLAGSTLIGIISRET